MSLVAYSEPEDAIEIAKTNKELSEVIARSLADKYQLFFEDFQGFLESYYTTFISKRTLSYLSPSECFSRALRAGNLELAEKFFQYDILVNPQDFTSDENYSDACLSKNDNVLEWLIMRVKTYRLTKKYATRRSVEFAIRSGRISMVKRVLPLVSIMTLQRKQLIYYACLSNSKDMFKFVTSHFDLSQERILIKEENISRMLETTIENDLDWNYIYTCAYNTMAKNILEYVQERDVEIKYFIPDNFEKLPVNPDAYDHFSSEILKMIRSLKNVVFDEFYELVESRIDGRGPSNRYLVLERLDIMTQGSDDPMVVKLRNEMIGQAVKYGFINIANFLRRHGFAIGEPIWKYSSDDDNLDEESSDEYLSYLDQSVVPDNPVALYWYRESPPVTPSTASDYKRYLVSYRESELDDPFIPPGVTTNWLIDRLLEAPPFQDFGFHSILDHLMDDSRFDPNYRLLELIRTVKIYGYTWGLKMILSDPRVNLNNPDLQAITGDIIKEFKSVTMMDIHLHAINEDRSQLTEVPESFREKGIGNVYLLTDQTLANGLNHFHVPWIPHFNSLIVAIFLSGVYSSDKSKNKHIVDERVCPASTHTRILNVIRIMRANKTYGRMLKSVKSADKLS
ncbi:Hypothetical protein POVR1_LOCUS481 [uncultured virus]|nr:Hypothetical protein POVR1_LOCUS481 [uncultured virus]